MNLVLFDPTEIGAPLPRSDRRVQHVLEVLHRQVGDSFDAGVVNGPRGKATVTRITPEALELRFQPTATASSPPPITLLVGLPRPQTARDILRDATTLGVSALHFVRTDKGEPNYAQSTLWRSGEWRRHALAGAEQAFDTQVPEVSWHLSLPEALQLTGAAPTIHRLALDNYEATGPLSAATIEPASTVVLALGAERGWSAAERTRLRSADFRFVNLGARVLRTETAVVAALGIVRAKLGLM